MRALWIFLGLIKVIGIILLILLVILMALLLFILISPIRYEVEGEKKERLLGSFHVRWLCKIIHIYGAYSQQEGFRMNGRLFGIPVFGEEKKRNRRRKKEKKKKEPLRPAYEGAQQDISMQSRPSQDERQENLPREDILFSEVLPDESLGQPEEVFDKVSLEKEEEKPKENGIRRIPMKDIMEVKPEDWEERVKHAEPNDWDTLEEEKEEKKSIRENRHVQYFLHLANKKKVLKAVFEFIKRVLGGVLPRHLRLKATIGTGDPATTGYMLAAVGIAKGKFGDNLQIKGEFTRMALEDISLLIKGKIRIGYLLYSVLRLLWTKEIRKIIWYYWKGERKNGCRI